jgi:hypothetical protein
MIHNYDYLKLIQIKKLLIIIEDINVCNSYLD